MHGADLVDPAETREAGIGKARTRGGSLLQRFLRWDLAGVVSALAILSAVLTVGAPSFGSTYNLDALSVSLSVTAIVAIAQMVVLGVGQFNVAITAIGAITGVVTAWLMQDVGAPFPVAIVVGLILGAAVGAFQGAMIELTKINPFIVSLALASVGFGLLLGVTQGGFFNKLPPAFIELGHSSLLFVRLVVVVALAVAAMVWVVLHRTALGREMLATGANRTAASYSGIDVSRITVIAHALSGGLTSVAAVLLVATLGSAQTSLGSEWLFASFAAPVLGGTLLTGGRVSVLGAILGAILLAVINNGIVLFGISSYWYEAFLGGILLGALMLDRARQGLVTRYRL